MTDIDIDEKDPLQTVDTYTGKLYWLNSPSGKTFDMENLKDSLKEKTFQENIAGDLGNTDIILPEVFEQDGQMVRMTTTENVQIVDFDGKKIITGSVVLDNDSSITYRNKEILILDTTEAQFLLFEQGGLHYLVVLGSRGLANTVVDILGNKFPEFGSTINETRLGEEAISNIRESLEAKLMDTIITDYDQDEITQTRIRGEDYEDTDVYDTIDKGGKVKLHMFQSDILTPEDTKSIQVGRDGLVRIYSNARLQVYLRLIQTHIIPEVYQDVSSSPSVSAWDEVSRPSSSSIFKDT